MTGWLEDNALRSMFEFTDQDIADLNLIIPDMQQLALGRYDHVDFNRLIKKGRPLLLKILAKERSL